MKPTDETPLTVEQVFTTLAKGIQLIYRETQWEMSECESVYPAEWTAEELIAQCSAESGIPIEFFYAPRILKIGNREVYAGEITAPTVGTDYWIPTITLPELFQIYEWDDDENDRLLLKHGLVHLTQERALAHAEALILASSGSI